ncbi:MAG: TonB-dependent receptor [Microscillaceae bacterium]|nr:TonB-dependent receptor [Microscillaceae bacterium]
MKHILSKLLVCFLLSLLNPILADAQEIRIEGRVLESKSKEPMIGVNIAIKGKVSGTVTNAEGRFTLITKTPPPFTLMFSSVGYAIQEVEITGSISNLDIKLQEESLLGREIVIAASRYEENVLESPVSIEKLDLLDIRSSPAADFYSGLRNLKGVDMGVQSLIFVTPNVRGFSSNTNYRVNQLVDGIDNAPPGLNFPAGNIIGISELDIESLELLVGASSALYGPGGLNGTILMTSKSPFDYQGLSASVRYGLLHVGADYQDNPSGMYDFTMRYAKAFNDRFAFKLNFSYLTADDWQASDFRDKNDLNNPDLNILTNPGYDGVNMYGDESFVPVDIGPLAPQVAAGFALGQGLQPGTPQYDATVAQIIGLFPESQLISRTGYPERDLADYNTSNLKTNLSLHYRLTEKVEAIVQGSYNVGTSVYTASNRFSLKDFSLYSIKAEVRGPKFFLRAFTTGENAGDTYDMGGLALQMNEAWKPSEAWYNDYIGAFTTARFIGQDLNSAYRFARDVADNRDQDGNILIQGQPYRPLPGEEVFNDLFNQISSRPISETFSYNGNTIRGAAVVDKSKLYHFEGMYNFSDFFKFADILGGMSYRVFNINSEGTIFADQPGDPHLISEFGAYLQITKQLLSKKLKFTGTVRYDKNENFDGGRFTPRVSLVYSVDKDRKHHIRGSIQTAFRFPSVADQYTNLNVGVFEVIGGLPQFRNRFNFEENPVYPLDNPNPLVGKPVTTDGPYVFPEFKPERVVSYEIGYKGLITDQFLLDAYIYYNTFNGFLANQALGQPLPDGTTRFLLTAVSTEEPISAYGWAVSFDYRIFGNYDLAANVSYNTINSSDGNFPLGFLTRFNSPDYRTNISLSNRNVFKNIGFSVNWRWQNQFLWESSFGVGEVPGNHTVDAQISYKLPKIKTMFKIGGSNLFNQYYTTGFGNPQIGGLYYIGITFDQFMN